MAKGEFTMVEAAGREVRLSNPGKLYFPKAGHTKLDLAEYYLEVAEGALVGLRERPGTMKRFVDGVEGDLFFQKRVPKGAPDWLQTLSSLNPLTHAVDAARALFNGLWDDPQIIVGWVVMSVLAIATLGLSPCRISFRRRLSWTPSDARPSSVRSPSAIS